MAADPELDDLYQKVIRQTRYQGSYEGGRWIAYVCWDTAELPEAAYADDVPCMLWWLADDGSGEHPRTARIGRGETPDAALKDLERRWRGAGSPLFFEWSALENQADA